MCGICGVTGRGRDDTLDRMSGCLTHRGPNAVGTYSDDSVSLANQRLSVIDVDGGDQPIYNEDGDVVVVYNGELYNFRELRSTLQNAGHDFTTDTDTEVFAHGYEEYGTDLFGRLNGMFAVAIYDATERRLLLARDRVGIKPLYYAPSGDSLLFASEPKAILRSGEITPAVDRDALRYFLQLRYSPSETTLFDGIETLLPGTYLDCRLGGNDFDVSTHTYWDLSDTPSQPPSDPVAAVRSTLKAAVDRQLVSDVPVGFYLSGGFDTSSVVGMASELRDEPIHTFCMGFADSEWDEREDARAVANHFGTNHHELTIDGDFMRDFPSMIWHADEPKRNLYPYYVANEMADHVTVALGGLGADELFGGYVYRYSRLGELDETRRTESELARRSIAQTATAVQAQQLASEKLEDDTNLEDFGLLSHIDDPARLYVLLNSSDVIGDIESYESRAFGPELTGGSVPAETIRERWSTTDHDTLRDQALAWDFTVKLPNDFLLVEDRMSMAHSLESRVPFLDNELVDLAFSLPYDEKAGYDSSAPGSPTVGKELLRKAVRPVLPDAVFEKDKQGFTMPTYEFVDQELLSHARNILDGPAIVRDGLIDRTYLDRILSRNATPDLTHHYKFLWKLVALEIWYQMYIVRDVAGPEPIDSYYSS